MFNLNFLLCPTELVKNAFKVVFINALNIL